jgi:hypothetical protein
MARPALLAARHGSAAAGSARARVLGLVGADVARGAPHAGRRNQWLLALVAASVAGCLGLVALRVEILRTRYELAHLAEEEAGLLEARSALLVEVRELRHPERLARLAARRGFGPPERVIHLAEPAPGAAAEPRP